MEMTIEKLDGLNWRINFGVGSILLVNVSEEEAHKLLFLFASRFCSCF